MGEKVGWEIVEEFKERELEGIGSKRFIFMYECQVNRLKHVVCSYETYT